MKKYMLPMILQIHMSNYCIFETDELFFAITD